jgi:hypothetical protein
MELTISLTNYLVITSYAQTQIPLPAGYNNGTYTIEIYYSYNNNQIRLYGEMQ